MLAKIKNTLTNAKSITLYFWICQIPDFSSSVIENDQLLGCHILMAEAFQKHYRSNLSSEKPSQDPQSYFDHKSSSSSVRSSIYNFRTFPQDIKKGDLILSSPRRSYDPFLIGIVEDNFSKESRLIIDPFLENEFTFRSVKWVSSYTSKHDLSASLAVRLENQRAITQIDRSIYGDEVFSVAFKQYSTSDSSKLDIFCPKYTGRNPLETVPVQELIAFFSVLFSLHQQGKLSDIRNEAFQ